MKSNYCLVLKIGAAQFVDNLDPSTVEVGNHVVVADQQALWVFCVLNGVLCKDDIPGFKFEQVVARGQSSGQSSKKEVFDVHGCRLEVGGNGKGEGALLRRRQVGDVRAHVAVLCIFEVTNDLRIQPGKLVMVKTLVALRAIRQFCKPLSLPSGTL